MDTAKGVVISVKQGAGGGGRAMVGIAAREFCRRCADGRGCGAGVFGRDERERRLELDIPEGCRLSVGQTVTLAVEERRLFAASLLIYGWPLAGVAAGTIAGQAFAAGDAGALAGAVLGFAAAAAAARRRLAAPGCLERMTPRITD